MRHGHPGGGALDPLTVHVLLHGDEEQVVVLDRDVHDDTTRGGAAWWGDVLTGHEGAADELGVQG